MNQICQKWVSRSNLLTASKIKWIALVIMTVDHIGSLAFKVPVINDHYYLLRSIGRIAMPLFVFLLAESFQHTRSKWKFTLRLYAANVFTCICFLIYFRFSSNDWYYYAGIMPTLFYIVLFSTLIDAGLQRVKARDRLRSVLCFLAIPATFLLEPFFQFIAETPSWNGLKSVLFHCFLPSPFNVEYSVFIVALGVALCFSKSKWVRGLMFGSFSVAVYILATMRSELLSLLPSNHYLSLLTRSITVLVEYPQHYMILALPIMLLYNGKKGAGLKYFFYIYYPLHIIAILIVVKGSGY